MKSNINQTTLHPYSRSVSIIGVGCTPFMYTLDNPETPVLRKASCLDTLLTRQWRMRA